MDNSTDRWNYHPAIGMMKVGKKFTETILFFFISVN